MTAATGLAAAAFRPGIEPGGASPMRPILLWLLGIPIPVLILLYLFHVI